jgi:hydrogenase nickel incorporation protein HypA/HybF
MHEFSIATSIVENVLEFAKEQRAAQVLAVKVALGEFAHIEAEQLSFCYESITKNTELDGSALEIERIDAEVRCPGCSYRGRPKYWEEALSYAAVPTLQCPDCGKTVNVIEGEECAIKTVRFIR